jgi:tRNA(Leu) C34 or U34 (ribose-2'-O)-methylase TrmL
MQQNLGAMIRCAFFFGADGVLASEKNCAPLSPAASKASAGCLETMHVYDSDNLANTLATAANDGWLVLGADGSADAVDCRSVGCSRPTLLVMGNEGIGLRTNVRRACTALVKIMSGDGVDMRDCDSLNVSVATGILLHQLRGAVQGAPLPDGVGTAAVQVGNAAVATDSVMEAATETATGPAMEAASGAAIETATEAAIETGDAASVPEQPATLTLS